MTAAQTGGSSAHATGGCLCGAVRYEVTGALRDVTVCHCAMRRRTHGHIGAYTATSNGALRLVEARGFTWYTSSAIARRGFCGTCGGTLFWEPTTKAYIAIAGTLDAPTGLKTAVQIHVESAGDYYEIDDRIPHRPP